MSKIDNYITDQLWRVKSFSYLLQVQKAYPDITLYIFGGAMRDFYNSYYNKTTEVRDIDVFIDQRKMPALDIETLEPKIKLDHIDFFTTNKNFLFIENSDTILDYCNSADFTINSAYFNIKTGEIKYNSKFLSHIKKKQLSLLFNGNSCKNNMRGNYRLFCKYIILKEKLGFTADPKTQEAFKESYRAYLNQKDKMISWCKDRGYEQYLPEIFNELFKA